LKQLIKIPHNENRWMDELMLDRPRVISSGQLAHILKISTSPFPELCDVVELRKTGWEKTIIMKSMYCLNTFRHELGLEPYNFGFNRFHVVKPKEYEKKVRQEEVEEGRCLHGRAYLQRRSDRVAFTLDATHELAHMAAYNVLLIKVRGSEFFIRDRQNGFGIKHEKGQVGEGLNEAVTEIIAHIIRLRLVKLRGGLSPDAKTALTESWSYLPLIKVVNAIVDKISRNANDQRMVEESLFSDYFCGTKRFFTKLYKRLPGAAEILRQMGKTPADALKAAKKLKLKEIVPLLSDIVKNS